MSGSPYESPQAPVKTYSDGGFAGVFEQLYRKRIWMRVLGICLILGGAFYCLLIIGAIVGVPMILAGVYLYQAANHFENAAGGHLEMYRAGCDKLASAIQMGGILVLIGLVITLLYFAVVILVLVVGASGAMAR